jgi:subfamily B ATP-binding cassette protein MsbA
MTYNQLLIKMVRQYPWLILATTILGFSGALFNGASTALLVPILLAFLDGGEFLSNKLPRVLHKFLAFYDVFPGESKLIAMLATLMGIIILKNINSYISNYVSGSLSRVLSRDLRLRCLQVILDVDLDFYSKNKLGNIINQVNEEVNRTATSIRTSINVFTNALAIFVYLCLLVVLSWQLTLVSTLALGLLALTYNFLIKRARKLGRLLTQKNKEYSNKLLEILTGIRLVKTVGNENFEYKLIEKTIKEREKASLDSQMNAAMLGPFGEISGIVTVILIVLSGRYIFANNPSFLGTIILTYLVILNRLIPFVSSLNRSRSALANNAHSVEIVSNFLRRDNKPFMSQGKLIYTKLQKEINFENVTFFYPGHKKLVLDRINLLIPKGKTIALVGASGAGKSTIADLLPRFYDPNEGRITLDGEDLKNYDITTLRKAMGVVSQDTFLFNNSVRYNISYGVKDFSEEELITAAKRANAYEFILGLPKGFDTQIGDRGVMLSGGQRQRLAIARALLRNPDILILDEATSALDTVSERLVQEAIDELCRDRTTLVIAHRLSTIQKADTIVVLDKGKVVESGNHQELLAKNGYYARLYSMQFSDIPESRKEIALDLEKVEVLASEYKEYQRRISYEVRSGLNSLLGSLRLLYDGLIEDPQEESELIEESYESATQLLSTIESLEDKMKKDKE